jgi:hypothetical protein
MKNLNLRSISLMAAVFFYGILLGGVVYSHLVFFPPYLSGLPNSATLVNGPYALHDENFWRLIHPVTILALLLALVLNWKITARRNLIAVPLTVYVLALIVTFIYFVPELRAFHASPSSAVPPAEWFARGQRWQHFSWMRGSLIGLAMFPLLLALVTPERE